MLHTARRTSQGGPEARCRGDGKLFDDLGSRVTAEDGVVYVQDLDCNVYALSLVTGALKWEYQVNEPEKSGPGPNGVACDS
jgi:outer membrane protein assembly factor BamB